MYEYFYRDEWKDDESCVLQICIYKRERENVCVDEYSSYELIEIFVPCLLYNR